MSKHSHTSLRRWGGRRSAGCTARLHVSNIAKSVSFSPASEGAHGTGGTRCGLRSPRTGTLRNGLTRRSRRLARRNWGQLRRWDDYVRARAESHRARRTILVFLECIGTLGGFESSLAGSSVAEELAIATFGRNDDARRLAVSPGTASSACRRRPELLGIPIPARPRGHTCGFGQSCSRLAC